MLFMESLDVDQEIADILIGEGFSSLEEIAYVPVTELLEIASFDDETVDELRTRARNVVLTEAIKREENLDRADKSLLELEGMDTELAIKLAASGVHTRDDLGDLAVDELVEMAGIESRPRQRPDHGGARPLVRLSRPSPAIPSIEPAPGQTRGNHRAWPATQLRNSPPSSS